MFAELEKRGWVLWPKNNPMTARKTIDGKHWKFTFIGGTSLAQKDRNDIMYDNDIRYFEVDRAKVLEIADKLPDVSHLIPTEPEYR